MKKPETEQQVDARKRREQKELIRRKKELGRRKPAWYLIYLLAMLSIVYIIDEITSNIGSSLQSEIITEFFVRGKGLEYNTGLATYTAMTAPLYAVMIITPFYKSLADRFGRKIFLALNTIGMGIGMFVCMMSREPIMYICGVGMINFVMYNDMQVMYVMECAPEKHRAKLASLTKAIALLGVTVIPLLRDTFMGNDGGQWRMVYLIPAIAAVVVGIASYFLMSETPVFLQRRIAYLEMSEEERSRGQEETQAKAKEENGGVVQALKYIFGHKQMRAVALCAFVYTASTGCTAYYESIMKTGGMDTQQVTTAMYFIPFVNAMMTALSGVIIDYLGRKKAGVVLSGVAFVGLLSFILSANLGLAPALVGISYGFFIGGLWSVADMLFIIIPGESTPTNMRVSVVGTMGIISGVGNVVSTVILTVGMLFVKSIGMLCLCVSIPFMLTSIIILITKVHETKGVDLNSITGNEWEN